MWTYCRMGALLGSGQFGKVFKGMQNSGQGEVKVAVKTLKEGSQDEDRVKFLQEAAIMAQFRNHNVVTMFGVVTQGEPVSFKFIEGRDTILSYKINPLNMHAYSMDTNKLIL